MARHQQYQIKLIMRKDGVETEQVVSKYLMYKCDAERIVNYYNKKDSVFNENGDCYYYLVSKYEKKAK